MTHDERMHELLYSNDGRVELCERRMWRALTTAACGRIVYSTGWDERDAAREFDEYVAALESIGLDKSKWSAHRSNGNRVIRFENGGEIRFVSHLSQRLHGTRAGAVEVDV